MGSCGKLSSNTATTDNPQDEVAIQRQISRHCREVTQGQDRRFGQKEVPGSLRPHCWTVLLPGQEEDKLKARGCALLLREQRDPPPLGHHGVSVPGTPRRRFFPLHSIL